jgi:hypothetical protein
MDFGQQAVWGMTVMVAAVITVPLPRTRAEDFSAVGHQRQTVYHAPQKPGYTCWTGAWVMPDGDFMVAFTQATGPIEGRAKAPKEVMDKLSWYPAYDMTGLDLRNVHLRSADQGKTWRKVSEDAFRSPMNGVSGEAEVALRDGTVIRGVFGYYLPYNPELPRTGFLQRSTDGTKTWGKPEVPLDAGKYTAWPRRLRVLKDGRLLALVGVARVPANSLTRREYNKILEPLILVSSDAGNTWGEPVEVLPPGQRKDWGGEEFDAAELPNGDLLCVFRKGGERVRWQGVLKKTGKSWAPGKAGPSVLPHSGQPELLATREGPVLHVATSGVHWTDDAGKTWHPLEVPGAAYYPRSVQAADGRIFVFGHVGGDDPYGKVDQSIVMDSFRLERK